MPGRNPWARATALVLAAGYALAAATTTAFTVAADVVTAIPIVLFGVMAIWHWPLHVEPLQVQGRHPFRDWAVLAVAVLTWELVDYLARGSRSAHPTLSSMADAVDRHYLLKAIFFFLWLCLCAAVVRAGRPLDAS